MKFEISQGIIEKATKCRNNFDCLSDESVICKAQYCIDCNALFVQFNTAKNNNADCQYKLGSGNAVICKCPVRREIFRLYNR